MKPKPRSTSQQNTARKQILEILKSNRWSIGIISLAIAAGACLELVPPLVMKQVVDGHLMTGAAQGLWGLAGLYLGGLAGVQAASFLTNILAARTSQEVLHDLRLRLYNHLQALPVSYYDENPLGDIISRCTADVDTVNTLFSTGLTGLLMDTLRLLTVFIAMIALSPLLSLVMLLVLPPLIWVTNRFRLHIREAERQNRIAMGELNTHLQETLGGVEVIRAYSRESAFVSRFRRLLGAVLSSNNRSSQYSAVYSPLMQTLMAAVIALLLWSSARATLMDLSISLGTLTAFVLLFKRFFDPVTSIGEEWQTVQSALSGVERIYQVLSVPIEHAARGSQPTPGTQRGSIELEQVTFGYSPNQPVLKRVSFKVDPGEHVALVGRTGAGKSSIMHLVGGLYAPWQGSVRVASQDPCQLDGNGRNGLIGVVPQQVQLFTGSILENLTFGDSHISREAVRRAARVTGAEAFIETLPEGFDTLISLAGEGVHLSMGQRQLLALTRALVWDPAVLLFDEASSAIDNASEAAFRSALRSQARRGERTILTVAHRLSTAREADRVIVLDHGKIVEMGSPGELVKRGGRFAILLELETAGWDWRRGEEVKAT